MQPSKRLKPTGILALGLVLVLLGQGALVRAAPPAQLPPRPTPTPLPTSTPTPAATPNIPAPDQATAGSAIVLRARGARIAEGWQRMWTLVEWQDSDGAWQAVSGWQGPFDESEADAATRAWSVGEAQLGRGPFRWRVYEREGGALLGTSANFDLPAAMGETVVVDVMLEATAPPGPALMPVSGALQPAMLGLGLALLAYGAALALLQRGRAARR